MAKQGRKSRGAGQGRWVRVWLDMFSRNGSGFCGSEGALVFFRCHLEWLDQVKELLGAANMQHLKKSCFGHLFDIANLQFQGQLYHILVRNHLIPSIKDRLSFNLNRRHHEFGPVELALMTGLKFSEWYEPPKASTIHSLLFTNRRCLKFINISVAFRTDDLEKFKKYPWGRVSYEYLLKSTLSRRRVIDNRIRQQKSMAYDVYGFVLALQTWAYEFMPDLGRDCSHIVKTNLGRFPRIFRWRVDEFYHYEQLLGYFAPEYAERLQRHISLPKLFVTPPLKRKAGEGDVAGAAAKKRRLEPTVMKDRLRSGRLKDKIVHVDSTVESKSLPVNEKGNESHVEEIGSNVTLQEIDGKMKALVRKLDVIESLIRRCKCCWKVFAEAEAGAMNEDGGNGVEPDEGVPNEVPEDEEKESVEVGEAVDEKCEDDGWIIGKKDLVDDLMKPVAVSPKTDKGLGLGVSSPPPKVSTRSSKQLSQTPLKSTCQRQLIDEEEPDERTSSNEPETPFPIISKSRVPVSWFHDLLQIRGWLADEHIDALTDLLLFKYKRANESFVSGWVVLDVLGTEQKKMGGKLRDVWEIISAPDAPQQGNNHECGIMAIKYIECLASNQDISSVDLARCGIWRRSYCAQLFELGREFPA
ncbi:hypothetical protein C2S52_000508 [Perilla frutescens var. hirtella]|nr:hypothetical protein C2S52_000508 [Perilla frutescens var. hirtella]